MTQWATVGDRRTSLAAAGRHWPLWASMGWRLALCAATGHHGIKKTNLDIGNKSKLKTNKTTN